MAVHHFHRLSRSAQTYIGALASASCSLTCPLPLVVRAQEMANSVVEEPTLSQSIFVANKYAKQQTKFARVAHDSHERLNGVHSQVAQVTGHQLVGDVRKVMLSWRCNQLLL